VLDVGATCGALSLPLQTGGHEVTAIDRLPQALTIMRERGVRDVRDADLFTFRPAERFDTVLLLMNGTALAGTLPGLDRLLTVLHHLVSPEGRVLVDSTDLRERGAAASARDDGRYLGEIEYQLEYRGHRGSPIPQLFVDPDTLRERAHENGWGVRVGCQEDSGRYLGILTRAAP
jgi:2-polyprenyl-3-methyl-5-hydroxy-6-metoxy-1,4-benzoquinol methylase